MWCILLQVFKATKRGHSQPVAVKIIELDDQADDAAHDQTRRIAREQSLLQELVDSRYFVCFLGAFQTSTSVGMVFEVCPRELPLCHADAISEDAYTIHRSSQSGA